MSKKKEREQEINDALETILYGEPLDVNFPEHLPDALMEVYKKASTEERDALMNMYKPLSRTPKAPKRPSREKSNLGRLPLPKPGKKSHKVSRKASQEPVEKEISKKISWSPKRPKKLEKDRLRRSEFLLLALNSGVTLDELSDAWGFMEPSQEIDFQDILSSVRDGVIDIQALEGKNLSIIGEHNLRLMVDFEELEEVLEELEPKKSRVELAITQARKKKEN